MIIGPSSGPSHVPRISKRTGPALLLATAGPSAEDVRSALKVAPES